jgi:steroid delta-isomerase-like uncharacterized protein
MNRITAGNSAPVIYKHIEYNNLLASGEPANGVQVWQRVLDGWAAGDTDEVVNEFADEFTFFDHALRLEFRNKDRLREYLVKIREFFSESERRDRTVLGSEDRIVSQWTLVASQNEPFLNGRFRKVKISAQGVSVLRIVDGRIAEWSEYYDQVNSRRYPIAAWFTDWREI